MVRKDLDSPRRELSNGGLESVVTLLVCWKINSSCASPGKAIQLYVPLDSRRSRFPKALLFPCLGSSIDSRSSVVDIWNGWSKLYVFERRKSRWMNQRRGGWDVCEHYFQKYAKIILSQPYNNAVISHKKTDLSIAWSHVFNDDNISNTAGIKRYPSEYCIAVPTSKQATYVENE